MPLIPLSLSVNGAPVSAAVAPTMLLVAFLREHLGLTGTHVGCDTSQCGACTVLLDGRAVKACSMLAVQAEGRSITTIEGLATPDGTLHPMQEAFREHHALQCGFCTPGMVLRAVDLAGELPVDAEDAAIRAGLDGNLCRCTGYHGIIQAVRDGANKMRETG